MTDQHPDTSFTPGELHVAQREDIVWLESGGLRLRVRRFPFGIWLGTESEANVLTPPAGTSEAIEASPRSEPFTADHPDVFDTSARYAGVTFRVDGSIGGGHWATGRSERWYRLERVRDWAQEGLEVSFEVETSDPVPRIARLRIGVEGPRTARVTVDIPNDDLEVVETSVAFAAAVGESFHGLGERFTSANHRGRVVCNWTEDAPFSPDTEHDWTYFPVPFLVSSHRYGAWLDTTSRAWFHLASDRKDAWSVSIDGSVLSLVLFLEDSIADTLAAFTARTGRPRVPPPWGLAVWKTTLSGEVAVRSEVDRLADERLGVSAVWIYDQVEPDTNSGWGSPMGYPVGPYDDIPGLVRDLHDRGVRVLGYLNPQFPMARELTKDAIGRGYMVRDGDGSPVSILVCVPGPGGDLEWGPAALLDPTREVEVAWWQELLRRLLVETGYDGWMHDFGEYTPPRARLADGRSGWEARNDYPRLYQQAGASVIDRHKPDAVIFCRSGYTGSNAHAPVYWPGDQHFNWAKNGLQGVLNAGLSAGLSGVATWGPDIGGFFGDDADSAGSEELWIRWCQFGALTPLMRDHLGDKRFISEAPIDLWASEATRATWRKFAALHNALVPYLYAAARVSHASGMPILRHLVIEEPDDPRARDCDDQYLLGPSLLVAPVIEPAVSAREVYVPHGDWYDLWTDGLISGSRQLLAEAELDRIPVLVRAGSTLVLDASGRQSYASVSPDMLLDHLEFRVYPSSAGATTLDLWGEGRLELEAVGDVTSVKMQGAAGGGRHVLRLPPGWTADGDPLDQPDARVDGLPRGHAFRLASVTRIVRSEARRGRPG